MKTSIIFWCIGLACCPFVQGAIIPDEVLTTEATPERTETEKIEVLSHQIPLLHLSNGYPIEEESNTQEAQEVGIPKEGEEEEPTDQEVISVITEIQSGYAKFHNEHPTTTSESLYLDEKEKELERESLHLNEEKVELEKGSLHLNEEQVELEKESLQLNEEQVELEKESLHLNEEQVGLEKESLQLDQEHLALEKESSDQADVETEKANPLNDPESLVVQKHFHIHSEEHPHYSSQEALSFDDSQPHGSQELEEESEETTEHEDPSALDELTDRQHDDGIHSDYILLRVNDRDSDDVTYAQVQHLNTGVVLKQAGDTTTASTASSSTSDGSSSSTAEGSSSDATTEASSNSTAAETTMAGNTTDSSSNSTSSTTPSSTTDASNGTSSDDNTTASTVSNSTSDSSSNSTTEGSSFDATTEASSNSTAAETTMAGNTTDSSSNSTSSTTPSSTTVASNGTSTDDMTTPNSTVSETTPSGETTVETTTTTKPPKKKPPYNAVLNCRCGTQTTKRLDVGSVKVDANVNPWTVMINNTQGRICSGNIINSKFIITSASCLRGYSVRELTVRAALTMRNKTVTFTPEKIFLHPSYNPSTQDNNIALLEVKENIRPSKIVKFICLPISDDNTNSTGTLVTLARDTGSSEVILYTEQVKQISNRRCAALTKRTISKNTFCSAPPSRHCDGNGGDGGAYIVPGKGYSFTLKGLAYSAGCKRKGKPAVYTKAEKYINWVLYKTKNAQYCKAPSFRRELSQLAASSPE